MIRKFLSAVRAHLEDGKKIATKLEEMVGKLYVVKHNCVT